jgi:hypothetical protein
VVPWHSAYDTDETRSMRIDGALRVGRARRFALLAGHAGKEGGGGALLVRTAAGWVEAVTWEHGC